MNNNTKKHSDINPLMTELKKLSKTKEKNTKCLEYAIKKFQANRNNNKE